jgi:hypothetical protein
MIFGFLINDSQLVNMLGRLCGADGNITDIPAIFNGSPESWDSMPAVSFSQKECNDAVFADDVCLAKVYTYQFDVFSKLSADSIFDRVDFLLRREGFLCKKVTNVIEPNCKHKCGLYSILKEE